MVFPRIIRNKKSKNATFILKKHFPQTATQVANNNIKIMLNNHEDVFVIERIFESSVSQLAGYLGVRSTLELQHMMQISSAKQITDVFDQQRENGFDISNEKFRAPWGQSQMWKILRVTEPMYKHLLKPQTFIDMIKYETEGQQH